VIEGQQRAAAKRAEAGHGAAEQCEVSVLLPSMCHSAAPELPSALIFEPRLQNQA